MRWVLRGIVVLLAAGLGFAVAAKVFLSATPQPPDPPALVERIREVARLETLEVRLYKRVSFAPEPAPAQTVWGDVFNFIKQQVAAKSGRALVFADVSLGLDLTKLTADQLRVKGRTVEVALPPLKAAVKLRPEETEVIDSNLDSQQTAKLFELAKEAFEREVETDPRLQERAKASAERQVRALLITAGFTEVKFVPYPMVGASTN
ncbi:MAG: DUF4230 domain-containing protein [Archangium sp.]|nr:DUF4230 domain-containing protein [Archangium sp.]